FFSGLVEGEYFFILNHVDRITTDFTQLWRKLGKLNVEAINSTFDESLYDWGTTVLNYNIAFIGAERKSFGRFAESEIKTCRYCKGEEGEKNSFGEAVSFRERAHLISEALGNKKLVSLDECDYCNEYFSRTIEPSVVNYFSIFRSLHGISGKRGKKKLRGENFELDANEFHVKLPGDLRDYKGGHFSTPLDLIDTFVQTDVYKCLVKFLLALVPKKDLSVYKNTIQWLFENKPRSLPSVACLQCGNFYADYPRLIKYKRFNFDTSFPDLIGEFRYADIVMIFIVPF